MVWLYLGIAIITEVLATTALKFVEGYTRLLPTATVVIGYGISFYCLSKVLNFIPISITYAIWSGAGIVLVSIVGWVWLGQKLDLWALIGIGLILAGVLVINLLSNSVSH